MQAAGQLGYLVGDQRKQRRDHDRDLGAQERRQLVHERFAPPRRQHEQRRLTTQQTAHRLELALLELLKPESPSQRLVEQRIDRRSISPDGTYTVWLTTIDTLGNKSFAQTGTTFVLGER